MKVCCKCKTKKELCDFNKNRTTSDGLTYECKQCISISKKKYYLKNKEKIKKNTKEYREQNKEICAERVKRYAANNREVVNKANRRYARKNRDLFLHLKAKRRALRKNATLEGYDVEIKEIYKNCPEGYHVDHIHPLNNPDICGLHVPWNLQYLPAEQNVKKNNSFDGTVDNEGWK